MTCSIYSLLNWLYRGTETEEQIQKRLRNARAELDQSNSPGLFDHLLVNDDLETCYEKLKVIHQDHCYLALLFYNLRLQLGSSSFLNIVIITCRICFLWMMIRRIQMLFVSFMNFAAYSFH